MFQDVERELQECTDVAYEDSEKMKFIKLRLQSLKDELYNWNPVIGDRGTSSHNVEEDSSTPVLDPLNITHKGRLRQNRYKSGAEEASNSKTKKKAAGGTRRKRMKNTASGSGLGTQNL
ncbi:hypothetical protein C2S51_030779 [Perilla frutescens var. frutescens]|nr:hypothetical protein C2S51_030779 [Perilla frutescens var. frutescens]